MNLLTPFLVAFTTATVYVILFNPQPMSKPQHPPQPGAKPLFRAIYKTPDNKSVLYTDWQESYKFRDLPQNARILGLDVKEEDTNTKP